MKVDDKLAVNKFKVDMGNPHMKVNKDLCRQCSTKPCLFVCPSENFNLDENGEIVMSWDGCIECGAVIVACHDAGNKALEWDYPRGGFGIVYGGSL